MNHAAAANHKKGKMKSRSETTVITLHNNRHARHTRDLKEVFLQCLSVLNKGSENLASIVAQCLKEGTEPAEMVEWGVEAGYDEGWVRTTISRVLVANGKRRRKEGGGRKVPPEARRLAVSVIRKYRENAPKILLSAYRFAKRQLDNRTP